MAFSATVRSDCPTANDNLRKSVFCSIRLNGKSRKLPLVTTTRRKCTLHTVASVLGNKSSSINVNSAAQPARVLLERLFAHAHKLEEQMNEKTDISNLENLQSDLLAALEVLKQKEVDLQEAERMVMLEDAQLKHAKEELVKREEELAAASCVQKKLEEELKESNLKLFSEARQVEDLKFQLKERDQEVATLQYALSSKEAEMGKMRHELMKKTEEYTAAECELQTKLQILTETDELVKRQENELQELRRALQEKEKELGLSVSQLRLEEDEVKVAESKLAQQTMAWLLSQDEIRNLREEASRSTEENKQTMEEFQRVKKLLIDVRSELVCCQESLASSRQKMEEREVLLEKQLEDVEEQKNTMTSFMMSLKNAHIEVESERVKLRAAEARNKELERDLLTERELMHDLEEQFQNEKSSLQQAMQEMSVLKDELNMKSAKFEEVAGVLEAKESELVEAKLQIQHLESERSSLKLILEERDLELLTAKKRLEEVNEEVTELRTLMNSKEDQLQQATSLLKEQEKHAQSMQNELSDATRRYIRAESMVEELADLTNNLIVPEEENDYPVMSDSHGNSTGEQLLQQLSEKPKDDDKWQKKKLETELELTRENLRMKEIEVLAAQRSLAIKDQELQTITQRLDEKDKELKHMREEMLKDTEDLKKLYALAQERIEGRTVSDLAIEKLQLEASQLEIEAATSALQNLAEMSRELLTKASLSIEADCGTYIFPQKDVDGANESLHDVKSEVSRLSALTELLVEEAGLVAANS